MENKEPLKSVDEDIMTALSSSITGTDFTVDWERIKTALHSYTASRELETVVCAAVKASDGTIYRGHRHGHAMQACRDEKKELYKGIEQQGFVTTNNRYVTREEARKLQDAAGIPSADDEGYRGNTLFSEDLYQPTKDVILFTPPTRNY